MHLFDPLADPQGLQELPALTMGGETNSLGGQIGEWVRSGSANGMVYALVGGFAGDGLGVDTGSVYLIELGPEAP